MPIALARGSRGIIIIIIIGPDVDLESPVPKSAPQRREIR
jgi:hypothetical protein